jgi:NAD(P)-dependent dehydrogenase (short-subunit alcohol dehydrogenase family)
MTKSVLVTGANRGIGLEIVRGFAQQGCKVVMACRDETLGLEARQDIVGGDIHVIEMALDKEQSIIDAFVRADAVYGPFDILVNNAGALNRRGWDELTSEELLEAMQLHVAAPLTLIKHVLPNMLASGFGRIINVSSGWGSFNEGLEGPLSYAVSKSALNALTVKIANDIKASHGDACDVTVNSICPGWVHTRMGGTDAPRTPQQGAETAIWLGLHDKGGPNGAFLRDKRLISW